MRRVLVALMVGLAWIWISSSRLAAQDFKFEKQQIKERHKVEMKALKMKAKYQKQATQGQEIPKSLRLQTKHQLDREKRELRERQRDELQDLKDRERSLKESQARQ